MSDETFDIEEITKLDALTPDQVHEVLDRAWRHGAGRGNVNDLEIPERARLAAVSAYHSHEDAAYSLAAAIIAAMPICIAAELRRLRDKLKAESEWFSDTQNAVASGVLCAALIVQKRIDELDPK